MSQEIPILGPSSGTDIQVNPQKDINLYTKIEKSGARTMVTLRRTPGLSLVDTSNTNGIGRSEGVRWGGKEYFVIGAGLISIDDNDTVTNEGSLGTVSGRCVIAKGRSYLLIVDGSTGYTFNGTTFAVITDLDFPTNPTHAVYIDGFFLVNKSGTDNFYRSDLEDPTSWDPLLFEVASASPDNIAALNVFDRDLLALGDEICQRYYNQGGSGFNFAPYPNSIQLGLIAPYSSIRSAIGVTGLFVTETGGSVVATISGGQVTIESNDDDSEEIDALSTKSDAIGSIYTLNGLTFYTLTFPAETLTKEFILGRQTSHHRESYGIGRWRVNGLGYTGKRILAVDYANDNIYELDADTYTENGTTIICERVTQFFGNQNPISCNHYEVVVKQGVGLITGQGSDPKLQLAISTDVGKSFSGYRMKSMGGIGQYGNRVIWRQLGDFDQGMVTSIKCTEPTDFVIIGGHARL